MSTKTIESLVDGGKASAGPPLGPALGPMGVNIGDVINKINEKTKDFKGMKVPVTVIIDEDTKEFEIEVGSPPVSQLIKKELGIEKGAQKPGEEVVGDLKIEQVIKIAKMKEDSMLSNSLFSNVKSVIGSCVSMGINVEGTTPRDAIKAVNEGKFDTEIKEEKTELSDEELNEQKEEQKKLSETVQKKRDDDAKAEAAEAEAAKAKASEKEGEEKPADEGKEEPADEKGKEKTPPAETEKKE